MDENNRFDNEDWGFGKAWDRQTEPEPKAAEPNSAEPSSTEPSSVEEQTPDAATAVMDWLFNSKKEPEPPKQNPLNPQNQPPINSLQPLIEQTKTMTEDDRKIQRHYRIAGLTYLMSILALLVFRVALKNWDLATPGGLNETLIDLVFTMSLQLGIFIIAVLLLHKYGMKISAREVVRQSYIAKPKWWMIVFPLLMGCILLFATMGFSIFWQIIISFFGYIPSTSPSTTTTLEAYLLALFLTGVMPALGEEFMYRGIVLRASSKYGGFWWGVFATALMFGLGHAYLDQIFYATMLGILSGYMTLKFKNILPAVIIHFMNNSMSVTMDYLQNMNSPIVSFMDAMFDWLNGPNAGSAAIVLIFLWIIVLAIIISLVFVMRYFFNKENKAQALNPSAEQKQAAIGELNSNSQDNNGQAKSSSSFYPRPLLSGKKLLTFDIRDNVYMLGGFIMAIVATVASLIAGLMM